MAPIIDRVRKLARRIPVTLVILLAIVPLFGIVSHSNASSCSPASRPSTSSPVTAAQARAEDTKIMANSRADIIVLPGDDDDDGIANLDAAPPVTDITGIPSIRIHHLVFRIDGDLPSTVTRVDSYYELDDERLAIGETKYVPAIECMLLTRRGTFDGRLFKLDYGGSGAISSLTPTQQLKDAEDGSLVNAFICDRQASKGCHLVQVSVEGPNGTLLSPSVTYSYADRRYSLNSQPYYEVARNGINLVYAVPPINLLSMMPMAAPVLVAESYAAGPVTKAITIIISLVVVGVGIDALIKMLMKFVGSSTHQK
jgi:hypothetical protein